MRPESLLKPDLIRASHLSIRLWEQRVPSLRSQSQEINLWITIREMGSKLTQTIKGTMKGLAGMVEFQMEPISLILKRTNMIESTTEEKSSNIQHVISSQVSSLIINSTWKRSNYPCKISPPLNWINNKHLYLRVKLMLLGRALDSYKASEINLQCYRKVNMN